MNLKLSYRLVVWTLLLVVLSIASPFSLGAAAKGQQAQAQVLDHAEILCSNCFFGPTDYYYCFAADNKILVGVQRVPVLNWENDSKNYLTKFHRQWKPWEVPGPTVPITYDDKHIWVSRAAGQKDVKLTQSSKRDIFSNDDRCRGAGAASAH